MSRLSSFRQNPMYDKVKGLMKPDSSLKTHHGRSAYGGEYLDGYVSTCHIAEELGLTKSANGSWNKGDTAIISQALVQLEKDRCVFRYPVGEGERNRWMKIDPRTHRTKPAQVSSTPAPVANISPTDLAKLFDALKINPEVLAEKDRIIAELRLEKEELQLEISQYKAWFDCCPISK